MTKSASQTVGVHEAKTHLSKLLDAVALGEEISITRRGHEVARLVPPPKPTSRRRFGLDEGKFEIPDDFDDPLPEEVARAFRGEGT